MSVTEYLRRKDALHNTTFIITYEGGFYVVGDKLVPSRVFEQQHQLPTTLVNAQGKMYGDEHGEQLDGRNSWLNNVD